MDVDEAEMILPNEPDEALTAVVYPVVLTCNSVINKDFKFKRRLIAQVQRHPELYNTTHRKFSKIDAKKEAWTKIAKHLKVKEDLCRNTWTDLRWEYQRYVRRLRKFFGTGNKAAKRRPIMALETDMIFLWRFVSEKKRSSLPYDDADDDDNRVKTAIAASATTNDCENSKGTVDEDVVMVDEPVIVIDLANEENSEGQQSKSSETAFRCVLPKQMRRMANIIKAYPELYDSEHRYFNDYKRKGIIWNAIANEMNDKATKLMKFWFLMQTRLEWEVSGDHSLYKKTVFVDDPTVDPGTEVHNVLHFMTKHIVKNPNTVFKQSFYLRSNWKEPIENFKHIFNLLAALKKYPVLVDLTESMITQTEKTLEYFTLWKTVADLRYSTPCQCETTWLILRAFYWELMNMRKHGYQLQDKWYFESIITDLYSHVATVRPITPEITKNVNESAATIVLDENVKKKVAADHSIPLNIIQPSVHKVTTSKNMIQIASSSQQINTNMLNNAPNTSGVSSPPPLVLIPASTNTPQTATKVPGPMPPLSASPLLVQLPFVLPKHTKVTTSSVSVSVNTSSTPQNPVKANSAIMIDSRQKKVPISRPNITIIPKPNITMVPLTAATPAPAPPAPTPPPLAPPAPLPKITGALSLLNANEIIIELIASPSGNQLIVHGPPLAERYSLSMYKTAHFIREVMSIPLLHNKIVKSPEIGSYWQYLSQKFGLPTHICRACWNFLSENFNHFPQIAPMEELMKPHKPGIKVWVEAQSLFSRFDTEAVQKGWLKYRKTLPKILETIGKYPCVYQDLVRDESTKVPAKLPTEQEVANAWKTIRNADWCKIPNITEVFDAFKKVFWEYMCELERGIDHKWPQNWWHELSQLKYLLEYRYHNMEPFYYIVGNKMMSEIERCNSAEIKIKSMPPMAGKKTLVKVALTSSASTQSKNSFVPPVPAASNSASSSAASKKNKDPATANDVDRIQAAATIDGGPQPAQIEIDPYSLILAIRRHPQIYEPCSKMEKTDAWMQVVQEMNVSLSTCRLAFQRALNNYRIYKLRDPAHRCRIAQKYFKHMNDIYRSVKPQATGKLNIRTPTELNQSVFDATEPNDNIFPEHFVADINMSSSKPALVMKNWAYGVGNLPLPFQHIVATPLRELFEKYRPLAPP